MPTAGYEVKVWDPLVRVFHWALVAAFTVAFVTEDDLLGLHVLAGYTVLALVLVRIVWGFVGTRYARFSDFVYPPAAVKAYLKELLRLRPPPRYLGHNPAGGYMVTALLLALLAAAVSGLVVYGAKENAGPLAGWLAGSPRRLTKVLGEIHEFLADLSLALVILHTAGVLLDSLLHRENLIRTMFTGRKRA